MMLAKDPKKLAGLIIAARPEQGEAPESSDELDPGGVAAMDEFIAAIEKKDSKAAVVALKDFISMCSDDEDQAESEVE